METCFHYLPVKQQNVNWGLYLTAVGSENVPPHYETSPATKHPSIYCYTWKDGRVLPEYSILYLVRGRMIFESAQTGRKMIEAGNVVLLFPGVWHRYRQDEDLGYYWLAANGENLYRLVKQRLISPSHCIFHTGIKEEIRRPYLQILKKVNAYPRDNPHVLAAYVMQILSEALAADALHSAARKQPKCRKPKQQEDLLVTRALSHIWNHSHQVLNVDGLADLMEITRRTLERHFRKVLGRSVLEEIRNCRLQRAKNLLQQTSLPVNHVAMSAGFPSAVQMTNVFRNLEGHTPSQCRDRRKARS